MLVAVCIGVLVFYYSLTNYHKLRGLMPHPFIILVSVSQESGYSLVQDLTRVSPGFDEDFIRASLSSRGSAWKASIFL